MMRRQMTRMMVRRASAKRNQARAKLALRLSREQKRQVKEATGKNLDSIDLIDVEGYLKAAPAVYRPEPVQGPQGPQPVQGTQGSQVVQGPQGPQVVQGP